MQSACAVRRTLESEKFAKERRPRRREKNDWDGCPKKGLPINYYHPDLRSQRIRGSRYPIRVYRNSYITEFRVIIIKTERVYTDCIYTIIRDRPEITLYTTLSPPYSMQPSLQLGRTTDGRACTRLSRINIRIQICVPCIHNASQGFLNPARNPRGASLFPRGEKGKDSRFSLVN